MSDQHDDWEALYKPESQQALEELPTGEMLVKPMIYPKDESLKVLQEMISEESKLLNKDYRQAMSKGLKPTKKWKRMPPEVFQAETEKITDLYLAGVPIEEIATLTPLSNAALAAHVRVLELKKVAERRAERVTAEIVKRKMPLIEESAGLTLAILRDRLLEIFEDDEKKSNLSIKELEALSRIGERVDHMLRLATGQSTSNVTITEKPKYTKEEALAMVEKLRQINPIMDYGKQPSSRVMSRTESKGVEVPQMTIGVDGVIDTILVNHFADEMEPIVVRPRGRD